PRPLLSFPTRRSSDLLYEKPRWLILNKLDMVDDPVAVQERLRAELEWTGPVFSISALNGDGTQDLIWKLQEWLDEEKAKAHIERSEEHTSELQSRENL